MELLPMKSLNFEFLQDGWSDLAALGGFAETYVHTDPQSALVKLRTFAERMVGGIYRQPAQPQSNLIDLPQGAVFCEVTPKVVQGKLHALRIHGNKAAHGDKITQQTALWLIKEAYDLARWVYVAHLGGEVSDCPAYQAPSAGGAGADAKNRN
jgi:type I restriction enzyme R subunit